MLLFSERINPLTLNDDSLRIQDIATGQTIAVRRELGHDGRKIILTPRELLNPYHRYNVIVSLFSPIFDQAGMRMISKQWSFLTGGFTDLESPVIEAMSIGDDALAVLAQQVCGRDNAVDEMKRGIRRQAEALMRQQPEHLSAWLALVAAARNLERIADHATNIAEDVIYLVEGRIIRHGGGLPAS